MTAPSSAARARVRVTIDLARVGGGWCAGTFRGRIEEFQQPVCPRGQLCPDYVVLLRTIGKFSFRVN